MSEVYFYTLRNDQPDAELQFACRLSDKAWQLGHQVYIQVRSEEQAKQLDDLMWQFSPSSFVPHGRAETASAPDSPVTITTRPAPTTFRDLLINLTDTVCAEFNQFSRVSEIVAADNDSVEAGRARYRAYRDAGATLKNFNI